MTQRQSEVYRYIVDQNRQGIAPTIVEIGLHLGIRSYNGVVAHLLQLEYKGYITRDSGKARTIRAIGVIEEQSVSVSPGQIVQSGTLSVECVSIEDGRARLVISRSV